jgi:hypothetical protein
MGEGGCYCVTKRAGSYPFNATDMDPEAEAGTVEDRRSDLEIISSSGWGQEALERDYGDHQETFDESRSDKIWTYLDGTRFKTVEWWAQGDLPRELEISPSLVRPSDIRGSLYLR